MRLSEVAAAIEAATDYPLVSLSGRNGVIRAALGVLDARGEECGTDFIVSVDQLEAAHFPEQIVQAHAKEAADKLAKFLKEERPGVRWDEQRWGE